MDLNLTPNEQAFRDEFRAWLKENVPAEWKGGGIGSEDREDYIKYLRDWQRALYEGGWAGISWPKAFGGRGATLMEQAIFQEELARANAPQLIGTIGLSLVGPTIIAMGTEEQKARHLPKILSGEEIWCQGFSEPNAGSDLAALGTKAVRDGGDFVVNGQKIWTSFAQMADWCLLLVRTDSEAPKHKGLTCLLADMHADGVTVRPFRPGTDEAASMIGQSKVLASPLGMATVAGTVAHPARAAVVTNSAPIASLRIKALLFRTPPPLARFRGHKP